MSLEVDELVVAPAEQNHVQGHGIDPDDPPSHVDEGDVDMANKSGSAEGSRRRSTRTKHSGDQLDELRALPEIRSIPWKAGKELPAEASTEAQRVQTRGACLLVTRGEIRDPPCSHCSKDLGRFSACIALDSFFNGACATCQLATRANLCDFRKPDTLRMRCYQWARTHSIANDRSRYKGRTSIKEAGLEGLERSASNRRSN